ncbi:MAG: hypothetical protein HN867_02180 [Deltaproteobacteria bacterium]|nr:hypothetical protein [Deltaproteobacteria bacterium]
MEIAKLRSIYPDGKLKIWGVIKGKNGANRGKGEESCHRVFAHGFAGYLDPVEPSYCDADL